MESESEKPKETEESKVAVKKDEHNENEKPSSSSQKSPERNNTQQPTTTNTSAAAVATTAPASSAPSAGNSGNGGGVKKNKKRSATPGKSSIRRKRKREREEGAPKLPLTGYVRYMNFRRDIIKQECPDKTSIEQTKQIADEWNRMSDELKRPYLQAAEADRERYNKQLSEFNKQKKTEAANKNSKQQQQNQNKSAVNGPSSASAAAGGGRGGANVVQNGRETSHTTSIAINNPKPTFRHNVGGSDYSIPIFTDEFLEHNKTVDLELRTLRKSNIDYEQQNSVLEKHIESMKFGVEKMETENSELMEKNLLLETYLQKLKTKLAQAFSGLSIPSEPNGATMDNIDKYMSDLHSMVSSNSHGPASLNKAKDIIRKLDLQIQL